MRNLNLIKVILLKNIRNLIKIKNISINNYKYLIIQYKT